MQLLALALELKALRLESDFELAQNIKHLDIDFASFSSAYEQAGHSGIEQKKLHLFVKIKASAIWIF